MVDSSLIQFRALLARQHALQRKQHKRLARRIHDEVSQKLTLLALRLSMAGLDHNPPPNWSQKCQEWNGMVVDLGTILRDICNELRPPILDDLGLVAALQCFCDSRPHGHCLPSFNGIGRCADFDAVCVQRDVFPFAGKL